MNISKCAVAYGFVTNETTYDAWDSITVQTIQKCWYRELAGAFSGEGNESDRDVASNQIEADTDVEHCEELLRKIGIEDKHEWIHVDDDCPRYEYLTTMIL